MAEALHNGKLVHIVIDVQQRCCLPLNLRKARLFPDAISRFAALLAPEVPTVCVAYGSVPTAWIPDNKMYRRFAEDIGRRESPANLVHKYGLPVNFLTRGNSLFIKDRYDAFSASSSPEIFGLGAFLEKSYPNADTVIVTGMNTLCCIPMTLAGGIVTGSRYNFVVITDLLADNILEREKTAHPLKHKEKIHDFLPGYLRRNFSSENYCLIEAFSRVSFQLSQNLLRSLGKDSNTFSAETPHFLDRTFSRISALLA